MHGAMHELDPDGDVILVLQESINTPFAVWEDSPQDTRPKSPSSPSGTANPPPGAAEETPSRITESSASEETTEHVTTQPSPSQDPTSADQEGLCGGKEVRMRVSSRHLTLASRYFQRMFKRDWKESHTLSSDNSIIITISDWDPEAFLILMRIIHHKTRQVPGKMSLEMLAKFALLVDYYECLEAVEIFVKIRISKLKSTFPDSYSRDLILWLWIAWVFKKPRLFDKTVTAVTEHSNGPMKTLGLPIPKMITDEIDQKREDLINEIATSLRTILASFLKEEYACVFECRSILFGALSIQMREWKLDPKPDAPFSGFSVSNVIHCVSRVRTPDWSYRYQWRERHLCGFGFESVKAVIDGVKEKLNSFSLGSLLT